MQDEASGVPSSATPSPSEDETSKRESELVLVLVGLGFKFVCYKFCQSHALPNTYEILLFLGSEQKVGLARRDS